MPAEHKRKMFTLAMALITNPPLQSKTPDKFRIINKAMTIVAIPTVLAILTHNTQWSLFSFMKYFVQSIWYFSPTPVLPLFPDIFLGIVITFILLSTLEAFCELINFHQLFPSNTMTEQTETDEDIGDSDPIDSRQQPNTEQYSKKDVEDKHGQFDRKQIGSVEPESKRQLGSQSTGRLSPQGEHETTTPNTTQVIWSLKT